MGQRYFIIGALALVIGFQLRAVDSFVLTPQASAAIEKNVRRSQLRNNPYDSIMMSGIPTSTTPKTVRPPRWLGWAMLSVGAVLVLHGSTVRRL